MSNEQLEHRFRYHPAATEIDRRRHQSVREAMLDAARIVDERVPPGREHSLAITKLEEAMFWANAGIARNKDGDI
jgi:hypothetical protein